MGFPISIPFPFEQKRAPNLIMRKGTLTLHEFYHFMWYDFRAHPKAFEQDQDFKLKC